MVEFSNLYEILLKQYDKITEIKMQYLLLLQQLTSVSEITNEQFFDHVKKINAMGKIVIGIENDIIVCSGTVIIEPKIIRGARSVAHIEDIVVLETARKKGLAKEVLEHLKTFSIENNCYKIILDCEETLIPFYEKCGFSQKGVQMAEYF